MEDVPVKESVELRKEVGIFAEYCESADRSQYRSSGQHAQVVLLHEREETVQSEDTDRST